MNVDIESPKEVREGDRQPLDRWELRLYIADWEPRSAAAMVNLKRLCEEHLLGRYTIEVIDLRKTPQRCHEDQILAIPTLVRRLPLPEKRVIGTLLDGAAVAAGLEFFKVSPAS